MDEMDIGNRIAQLRKQRNLTQKELASYLSVTDKAVSRWESGAGYPELEMVPRIAKFFNVSTDYLLTDEGNRPTIAEPVPVQTKRSGLAPTIVYGIIAGILVTAALVFIAISLVQLIPFWHAINFPTGSQRGVDVLDSTGATYALQHFNVSETNQRVIDFARRQGKDLTVDSADFIQWLNSFIDFYSLHGSEYWAKGVPIPPNWAYSMLVFAGLAVCGFVPCLLMFLRHYRRYKSEEI